MASQRDTIYGVKVFWDWNRIRKPTLYSFDSITNHSFILYLKRTSACESSKQNINRICVQAFFNLRCGSIFGQYSDEKINSWLFYVWNNITITCSLQIFSRWQKGEENNNNKISSALLWDPQCHQNPICLTLMMGRRITDKLFSTVTRIDIANISLPLEHPCSLQRSQYWIQKCLDSGRDRTIKKYWMKQYFNTINGKSMSDICGNFETFFTLDTHIEIKPEVRCLVIIARLNSIKYLWGAQAVYLEYPVPLDWKEKLEDSTYAKLQTVSIYYLISLLSTGIPVYIFRKQRKRSSRIKYPLKTDNNIVEVRNQ